MKPFEPLDPNFESRVRDSFSRQNLMTTLNARLSEIAPGKTIVEMPYDESLTQQNGYLHAGIITAIIDSACGYAAYTLMPADADVLSVEFKINLLSPARGQRFIATGQVLKPGRQITVCEGKLIGDNDGQEKLVATMLATMITVKRPD